jgi:Polyketide cyclase / dehydrase and lipid transport
LAGPGGGLMTGIEVSVVVSASVAAVWEELSALERHTEWMADAERIMFRTEQTRGVGTAMDVLTRVGPLRTMDVMVIDRWDEGRAIGVTHRGIVSGTGVFTIDAAATGTRVMWREDLRFPWYLGGVITAVLARPVLRRIWKRNLDRLAVRLA